MSKKTPILVLTAFFVIAFMLYIYSSSGSDQQIVDKPHAKCYLELLSRFPIESQGLGMDTLGEKPHEHPMTYGLILSAESLRYLKTANEESYVRIKNANRWLLDNSDLDGDGRMGWGLPNEWDAFSDGTLNPQNQPYTITTAIVLQGMLDALRIDDIWTNDERETILDAVKCTSIRWSEDVWSDDEYGGGYFWYSPSNNDTLLVFNASSMMLGSVSRFVSEQGDYLDDKEEALLIDRINKSSATVIRGVQLRHNAPFWDYLVLDNNPTNIKNRPNDLAHHGYILWGMEQYRDIFGGSEIPWSSEQALLSLDQFLGEGTIYEYPHDLDRLGDKLDRPARVWGVGMMLALYARGNDADAFSNVSNIVFSKYGDCSGIALYPLEYTDDETFLPRYVAHVLYGISIMFDK